MKKSLVILSAFIALVLEAGVVGAGVAPGMTEFFVEKNRITGEVRLTNSDWERTGVSVDSEIINLYSEGVIMRPVWRVAYYHPGEISPIEKETSYARTGLTRYQEKTKILRGVVFDSQGIHMVHDVPLMVEVRTGYFFPLLLVTTGLILLGSYWSSRCHKVFEAREQGRLRFVAYLTLVGAALCGCSTMCAALNNTSWFAMVSSIVGVLFWIGGLLFERERVEFVAAVATACSLLVAIVFF